MNNKETLQNYNENLNANNISLETILEAINELPEVKEIKLQDKEVTPTKQTQNITSDEDFDGLSKVTISPIPDEYIVPSGTLEITENGEKDVTNYSKVNVNVETIPTLQDKSIEITESGSQSITFDEGYDGLNKVDITVNVEGSNSQVQYEKMPNIDDVNVNTPIQYIGETNNDFIKGQWYYSAPINIAEIISVPTGAFYKTNIIPSNHKVEAYIEFTHYIDACNVFGCYDPEDKVYTHQCMNFTPFRNGYWWGTDGTHVNGTAPGTFKTGLHDIIFNDKDADGNYAITLNGQVLETIKSKGDTELMLFKRGNTALFAGKFLFFKVWDLDTDELLLHIVPCEVNGKGGLFDVVTNKVVYVNSAMVCEGKTTAGKCWKQVEF